MAHKLTSDDSGTVEFDLARVANFTKKQQETFACIGVYSDIFAGGQRGGGKTHLAVSAAVICAVQVPGLRILVARKTADELRMKLIDDVLLPLYSELFTWYASTLTAKFDNGSVIYFKSFEHTADAIKVKGTDFGLIILDEGNEFEWSFIARMRGSLRAFGIPNWKPTMLITGNPGGVCDQEIIDHYYKPNYAKWERRELKRRKEYIYIEFGLDDNPHATEDYAEILEGLPEELYRAWRKGDWYAIQGRFFSEWNYDVHVIPHDQCVPPPLDWPRWRAIDLGYGKHPSVCLFATQDPEDGYVYVYNEVSTTETTEVFADMVVDASGDDEFVFTFFDPSSMKSRRGETVDSISPAQIFLDRDIYVVPANNERENGWRNLKMWMHHDQEKGVRSKLYVYETCVGLIETVPIQRYVEGKMDLNTKGKDDYVDAARYLMSHIPCGWMVTEEGILELGLKDVNFEKLRYPNGQHNKRKPADDLVKPLKGEDVSVYAHFE